MGIFGSKAPKEPQIKIVKQTAAGRVLDFSEFMDKEMKQRIREGNLDWMDKVGIFETFYIPKRISEGWVLVKGGRNDGERFQVEWKVGDESIAAKYNDGESTVTERLKKKKS
jgi:hypothetical protein